MAKYEVNGSDIMKHYFIGSDVLEELKEIKYKLEVSPSVELTTSTETFPQLVRAEDMIFLKPKHIENGLYINIEELVTELTINELSNKYGDSWVNIVLEEERDDTYDRYYDLVFKHEIKNENS